MQHVLPPSEFKFDFIFTHNEVKHFFKHYCLESFHDRTVDNVDAVMLTGKLKIFKMEEGEDLEKWWEKMVGDIKYPQWLILCNKIKRLEMNYNRKRF